MPPQQPQSPYGGQPNLPPGSGPDFQYPPAAGQNQPYPPEQGSSPYLHPGQPGQANQTPSHLPQPASQPYGGQPVPQYVPPHASNPSPNVIPPPPPRPKSPYDFFMNPQSKQKNGGVQSPFKNASKGAQLAMIAGGGLLLVIILGIATLFLPKGEPKLALVAVAQAQTETLRICSAGLKQAKLAPNRSFAVNCSLAMTTEQRQTVAQLGKAGVDADGDLLKQGQNAKADQQLAAAKNASNYDEVFVSVAQAQLTTQARLIKQAGLSASTTTTEKALLAKHAESTKLLLQQLGQ